MSELSGARPRRTVRSFVLREGRLTPGQERAFAQLWPRFGIDYPSIRPLDLRATFAAGRPITVEIGFGNGESLARQAAQAPQRNFVGIEVHRPGIGHLMLLAGQLALPNLKIIRHDAVAVLEHGLAAASIDRVQLFFPDPWPKKRHHKRRIVQPRFLDLLYQVLRPDGVFHAATDWEPYAEHMYAVLAADRRWQNLAAPLPYATRPADRPLTKFEQRGQRLGHGVRDLLYRRS